MKEKRTILFWMVHCLSNYFVTKTIYYIQSRWQERRCKYRKVTPNVVLKRKNTFPLILYVVWQIFMIKCNYLVAFMQIIKFSELLLHGNKV